MKDVRFTLVSEGRTDANLIPIIEWALNKVAQVRLPRGVHAELWRLPTPPRSLADKIEKALDLYPCDVLFIHRDADRELPKHRYEEIQKAVESVSPAKSAKPAVAVVPVRMLEAWLMFDERAIRRAAGNPNGTNPLSLPLLKEIEKCPDPKTELANALRAASELRGRRLKKFDTRQAFWHILDSVDDYSQLRQLPAYCRFEASVQEMSSSNWAPGFYGQHHSGD